MKRLEYCNLCKSTNKINLFLKDNIPIIKCPQCGLVYADIDITDEEKLTKIYNYDYFFGEEYLNYINDKKALQKKFKKIIPLITQYNDGGELLEIGSAYGFFLEIAKEYWNVTGIEFSEEACAYIKKEQSDLNSICGNFLTIPLKEDFYDVVCMWDTMEHLVDPYSCIKKINRVLKQGGIFCFTTCDIDSLLPKIQGEKWRWFYPPSHLFYYSVSTLRKFLEANNFEMIDVRRIGIYRRLDSIFYRLFWLNKNSLLQKFYFILKKLKPSKILYLNTFDNVFVIGRKIK